MKRIKLLATGGTIASDLSGDALSPALSADSLLSYLTGLDALCRVEAEDILALDSSNIQPEEWRQIAQAAYTTLEAYDGVVITHGTDTMAYTACALSFMLRGLSKPVVLTGAQLPITHLLSDARVNLAGAFAAACEGAPGVYVVFGNRIIQGARAIKLRSMGFDAFDSINSPCAGEVDARGVRLFYPQPITGDRGLMDTLCEEVCLVKLIPGTKPELLFSLKDMGYRGVVIEAFGVGGLHYLRRNLIEGVTELTRAGIQVVITSQCLYDSTDFSLYEIGRRLTPAGAIPAHDMTTEAAVTKLMWVLGQTEDPGQVRRLMAQNICGEVAGPVN